MSPLMVLKCLQSCLMFSGLVSYFAGGIPEIEIGGSEGRWPVDTGKSGRCNRASAG
jgi:hypothetical protein